MSKNFNIHDWQDKHLREGMYGMEEREDYVVVDKRNLRPLKMIYGPNQYYEKYFTEKGAQDAANDLNRAYQKTYGAAEGPHVVMYKSDYFAEKRKKDSIKEGKNKEKIRKVIREVLHKHNKKSHDKHSQSNRPIKTNRKRNKGISGIV